MAASDLEAESEIELGESVLMAELSPAGPANSQIDSREKNGLGGDVGGELRK